MFLRGEKKMRSICKSCGKIISHGKKCDCRKIDYVRNVDPEKKRFYSSYAWQKLRNRRIKEHPYCERCWDKWKIINNDRLQGHHILSFKDYPACRLDDLNVAVLCQVCNLQIGDTSKVDWTVTDEVMDYLKDNR